MFPRLVDLAFELIHLPKATNKHFSFILRRNNIVSIGVNYSAKTHPLAIANNFRYGAIHSELNAIKKCPIHPSDLYRCKLVNVRVNSRGLVCQSKPCQLCENMLRQFEFREIWYTSKEGDFVKL